MSEPSSELLREAEAYLLREFGEQAVRLKVSRNDLVDGSGEVEIECTIAQNDRRTDWTHSFVFRDGRLLTQRWKMHPNN